MFQPGSQQPINQNHGLENTLSRSLSLNCTLPPLSPFSNPSTSDPILVGVSMDDPGVCFIAPESVVVPTRRGHRRSNSDMPLGFSAMIQSSPQLIPISAQGALVKQESSSDKNCSDSLEMMGERKIEGEIVDDLFSDCLKLGNTNIGALNRSGADDKDMDSRASGTKKQNGGGYSSDKEVESSLKREGVKRSAGGEIAPSVRHFRSVSMDSFMGNINFSDESPNLPPSQFSGQSLPNSMDGYSAKFSLEFGNGEFSGAELKKIMANDKLAEIALLDPKRAKRILANRQSAARSKERKMRYISELEHKVQNLQTEGSTLSAQITHLQGESAGLTSQNSELKFRIQAMEQQAQLRNALNEALIAEVQRLKLATAEHRGS